MYYVERMTTVSYICDQIGRDNLARALGHKYRAAVSNAVTGGMFPSKWYLVVRDECAKLGIDCPVYLFAFIKAKSKDV